MKEGLTAIWKGSDKRKRSHFLVISHQVQPIWSTSYRRMNEWVKSFLYNLAGTMSTCPAPCSAYLPPDDVSAIGRGSVETSPPASGCGWEKSPCWWVREGWLLAFLISLQCTVAWSLITILSNTMIAKCYFGPNKKWLSAGTSAKCLGDITLCLVQDVSTPGCSGHSPHSWPENLLRSVGTPLSQVSGCCGDQPCAGRLNGPCFCHLSLDEHSTGSFVEAPVKRCWQEDPF